MGKSCSNRNLYLLTSTRRLCKVGSSVDLQELAHRHFSEIVKFREMLERRIERRDPPLTTCPDEHKPLIAKLANERYACPELIMR